MKKISAIISITMVLLTTGCGIQKQYIKAYNGPELPQNQVALVKPLRGIIVESIDGDESKKLTVFKDFGSTDADIALLPGVHSFVLNFSDFYGGGTNFSATPTTASLSLVAGRKYLLKAETAYRSWKPILVDVTDRPELWCLTTPKC